MDAKRDLIRELRDNETVLQVFPAEELLLEWERMRSPAPARGATGVVWLLSEPKTRRG